MNRAQRPHSRVIAEVNLGFWDNDTGGQDTGTIAIGALVKNYAFDGLGRLARTVSPYPSPAAAGGFNRTERFYYDGIRRIQEVYTDPVVSAAAAEVSGDAQLQQLANQTTPPSGDTQGTPLGLETGQLVGSTPIQPTPWLEREYVWGPGGGPGGIDELLVQYDNQRNPWWVMQDEGGDVAALCDLGAVNQDGRVAGQYTYDAYGSPLSFDSLHAHPLMHCGHKGLFVDRLDVGVVAVAGGQESHRLAVGARIICHNRNRTYAPGFGRFLQQDPNASGQPTHFGSHHGRPCAGPLLLCDPQEQQNDGANLFEYLGGNTMRRADALGTNWVEDYGNVVLPLVSMVDDFIGPGIISPLQDLYDNYVLLLKVTSYLHNLMDYQEQQVDWAVDWTRGDDDIAAIKMPKFGGGHVGDEAEEALAELASPESLPIIAKLHGTEHSPWHARQSLGHRVEKRARHDHDLEPTKHFMEGVDESGRSFKRKHDGRSRADQNLYMEVKAGNQGLTQRTKTQIIRDRMLMQQKGIKVKWVFYRSNKNSVSDELLRTLTDNGIPYSFGAP